MSELKPEAGRYYKTRDGRKAFVAAAIPSDPFSNTAPTYPIIGYVEKSEGWVSWCGDGRYLPAGESPCDLVAEWREPLTKGVMVYLSKSGCVCVNVKPDVCIASARVVLKEGEFAQ